MSSRRLSIVAGAVGLAAAAGAIALPASDDDPRPVHRAKPHVKRAVLRAVPDRPLENDLFQPVARLGDSLVSFERLGTGGTLADHRPLSDGF